MKCVMRDAENRLTFIVDQSCVGIAVVKGTFFLVEEGPDKSRSEANKRKNCQTKSYAGITPFQWTIPLFY